MFGTESTIRRDSLQRASASGLLHQLLVRFGNDVETLDDEALGDECSVEKKKKLDVEKRHQRENENARENDYDFDADTT